MNGGIFDPEAFGHLRAEVASLSRSVQRLEDTIQRLIDSDNLLHSQISEARGGWRMFMGLIGLSGAIGALISWIFSHGSHSPPSWP
jgi:hypothetical protein